jgi:SAM-dependent methyltransferase
MTLKTEEPAMNSAEDKRAWYETLYEGFEKYDDEPYTQQTEAEVDFVQAVIGEARDLRILDVGCGTGRHSLELARRGYEAVTGVDLSPSMLAQAQAKAAAEGLQVTFAQQDARQLDFEGVFDVALMLCEGGFSLMERDGMDRQIVRAAARALQAGGRLIMTAPSAAYMLARAEENDGFDPLTLREAFTLEQNGEKLACSQRYYTYPELKLLLEEAGLEAMAPFAVDSEGYRRDRKPGKDDFELGVMAVKG